MKQWKLRWLARERDAFEWAYDTEKRRSYDRSDIWEEKEGHGEEGQSQRHTSETGGSPNFKASIAFSRVQKLNSCA